MGHEDPLMQVYLEGRPWLDSDALEATIIQNAPIPVNACDFSHINIEAGINHGGVGRPQLQLINNEGLGHTCLQQLHLIGILIADAEITHLTGCMQTVEGGCHLVRLNQGIGPM